MENSKVIIYEATLMPCPFCGRAEQRVVGVRINHEDQEWYWSVECPTCTKGHNTEEQAIEAWNRRYKQHEVEQDGDITWDFYDLVVKCVKRYAGECRSRLDGADRPDTDLG